MISLSIPARLALLALAAALLLAPAGPATAAPKAKNCGGMTLGTAVFTKIKATGMSCATAKRLIDTATLSENRHGNVFWTYKGWDWTVQGVDEMTNRLRGKHGKRRISATWSAT
jgi:hypothetical protein